MGHLGLNLLGTPEVTHDGTPVVFRTRKTLALLAYLAVERRQVARTELVELLWPGDDPLRGRAAFRRTLVYLHSALGAISDNRTQFLIVKRDSLGFDFTASHDLDIRKFRLAAAQARRAVRPAWEDPAGRQRQLAEFKAALALARGEFLSELSFDDAPSFSDWVAEQRVSWREGLRALCDRLIGWQTEAGMLEEASAIAARWVALDPHHEPSYQRAIQRCCASGERANALALYATWGLIATQQLGQEPAPETVGLVEEIRRTRPPLGTAPCSVSFAEQQFVGRDRELGRLLSAFRLARQRHPVVALITSDAGIGKSRLVAAFTARIGEQGAVIVAGQPRASGARQPYGPIISALRDWLRLEGTATSPQAIERQQRLNHLLARLANLGADAYAPPEWPEETLWAEISGTIAALATGQAERAILVLVLDDFDQADPATRAFIRFALPQWAAAKVSLMLLVTRTSKGGQPKDALTGWLDHLALSLPVTTILLSPLSAEEITQRVRLLGRIIAVGAEIEVGGEALATLSRWLYSHTHGHPATMQAVLRLLAEQHILQEATSAGGWVVFDPGQITPSLRRQLAALQVAPDLETNDPPNRATRCDSNNDEATGGDRFGAFSLSS